MIIVDRALARREAEGRPLRVALVGSGFIGRLIARQILSVVRGMDLVAVSNRHLDGAARCYRDAGVEDVGTVDSAAALEDAVRAGRPVISDDPDVLCQAENVDAIIEATGTVEFAARVAVGALDNAKHLVLVNAELDATLGPILKVHADKTGVVVTNTDGDQPGALMNLYRFAQSIGARPVLCGSIKTYYDRRANAESLAWFARQWGMNARMVASFTDGSKLSLEQALVANATGMTVGRRGMCGPEVAAGTNIREAVDAFPVAELLEGPGWVDYVRGADPSPGVFVLATLEDAEQRRTLEYYKMGKGPLYCFYTPYHLAHFEVPFSVARAVLFGDATIAPQGAPCVDVVSVAKVDLRAGDVLDGVGGNAAYGLCETAELTRQQSLLPLGLSEGCRLRRALSADQPIAYDDVEVPQGRLCDRLRAEQQEHFARAAR